VGLTCIEKPGSYRTPQPSVWELRFLFPRRYRPCSGSFLRLFSFPFFPCALPLFARLASSLTVSAGIGYHPGLIQSSIFQGFSVDIQRINPSPRWSDATVYNGIAHFVEVAEGDTSADIVGQAQQIFEQAEASLATVGSDKSRILSVTIYVTDFASFASFNAAWEAWLPAGCAPSRACVKAELARPELLVEIAFVAAAGQ
jgi:enamine deaminase RidA (YjgF/YER057c/UK114 family)